MNVFEAVEKWAKKNRIIMTQNQRIKELEDEIIKLKTQMLPNEYEQLTNK